MTYQKSIFLKYTTSTIISSFLACAPKPNTVPENKYGLHVIGEVKSYYSTIQTDSNKRMVRVEKYISPLNVSWKYATKGNFTRHILYYKPVAYLRLDVTRALQCVVTDLLVDGLTIKLFDAYRPYKVTEKMWEILPDSRYAANPAKGSGHNRGAAVDLTLISVKTGIELEMPTEFDDFTERAHHNYANLAPHVIANRELLKKIMEKYGFKALETEWWHYYLPKALTYELLNLNFRQMEGIAE